MKRRDESTEELEDASNIVEHLKNWCCRQFLSNSKAPSNVLMQELDSEVRVEFIEKISKFFLIESLFKPIHDFIILVKFEKPRKFFLICN